MSQPSTAIHYRSLLAVGVCLPAVLAVVNHLLLTSSNLPDLSVLPLCLLMGFYLLQIGLIGWSVAAYIQPWPLRWVIYGWIMVLIDLQLASLTSSDGQNSQGVRCLSAAIMAGQLGMFIVWGILGSGRLAWRLPAWLVLLMIHWSFYSLLMRINREPPGRYSIGWEELLVIQGVLLSVLCGILRLRGYSLLVEPGDAGGRATGGGKSARIQFGIRDVLIWTTSLAVVLAFAKAGDLLTSRFVKQLYDPGLLLIVTIAVCTAVILLVALWAALGRDRALVSYSVLFILSLAIGACIGYYCDQAARKAMAGGGWYYSYFHWYFNGYWWIGWMFLTGTLLAASLIIFRALGYRLVRGIQRRPRSSLAAVAPNRREGIRSGTVHDAVNEAKR